MFVQTDNYLIIFNILFEDGEFLASSEKYYIFEYEQPFKKISNRYKIDGNVLYSITEELSSGGIIPKIYRYNLRENSNEIIFSENSSDFIESDFDINFNDSIIDKVDEPVITYSSRNNILKISMLAKDQNDYFTIHEYDFAYKSIPEFLNHKVLKSDNSFTNNISNLNIYLDSGILQNGKNIIL
jgi:hypothetical protein